MDINALRIANLRTLANRFPNQTLAAEAIKTTDSYFSQLLSGKNPIGKNLVKRIEKAFGVSAGWLDEDHTQAKVTYLRLLKSGDLMSGNTDDIFGEMNQATFQRVSNRAFAIEHFGDSMDGIIDDGNIVIVEPAMEPVDGSVVTVRSKIGIYVRHYVRDMSGKGTLRAKNKKYKDHDLQDDFKILGVVVEAQAKRIFNTRA